MTFFLIKAIIFDFNGVIVDDEDIHRECFQRVLIDEDIQLTEEDYWNIYLGFDDKGLFEAIYDRDEKNLTPKKLRDLIHKKNLLYIPIVQKRMKLFPGLVEFIQQLQQPVKKYPLAIVSGALRSEIETVLKTAQLEKYFEFIVSADDTKRGKPDPEGYLMAFARLKKSHPQIHPQNCLVIEDSLAGIESAKRAEMQCVALTHSYSHDELSQGPFKPDQIVRRFSEILI